MSFRIRLLLIRLVRCLTYCFHIFPIKKNKIIFISFNGKQMSCNPYYIMTSIKKLYPEVFNILWVKSAYKNKKQDFEGESTIREGTLKYLYNLLTAGCIITNDTLPTYLKFSKKQLVINTWHGGGLFKQTYGKSSSEELLYSSIVNGFHNEDTKLYLISSKSWLDNVVKRRFNYYGEVLLCGMPRNDIFYKDRMEYIKKIKDYYGIPQENGIVLYAPTFRGIPSSAQQGILELSPIDISQVVRGLQLRFEKHFSFIYRGHHLNSNIMNDCINASDYPDMQELLMAADVFISDYSSCLWDFSLTKRPAFIYAPDFDEYSQCPGFESDYRGWPFEIARSNQELVELIRLHNTQQYTHKCDLYHEEYGSYESGTASDTVAEYVVEKLSLEKNKSKVSIV